LWLSVVIVGLSMGMKSISSPTPASVMKRVIRQADCGKYICVVV